jgi:hypothetical protein
MVGLQRPSKRIELCASFIRSNEQTCFEHQEAVATMRKLIQ